MTFRLLTLSGLLGRFKGGLGDLPEGWLRVVVGEGFIPPLPDSVVTTFAYVGSRYLALRNRFVIYLLLRLVLRTQLLTLRLGIAFGSI